MSSVREKLISYLAAGVSQSAAAEAVGVTPSYVTQLLDEEGVRSEIAAARGETLNKQLKQDELVERGEKAALEKLINMLPYAKSLGETAKVFSILNGAKRKAELARATEDNSTGLSVTITLPQAAALMLNINSQNQVVEIQGKSIAPLPSRELPKLADRLKQRMGESHVPALEAVPRKQHVEEFHQRQETADQAEATRKLSILDDHKLVLNGVQVVI